MISKHVGQQVAQKRQGEVPDVGSVDEEHKERENGEDRQSAGLLRSQQQRQPQR